MIITERITFDSEKHAYHLDGNPVPSITEILSHEGLSGDGNGFWRPEHRDRGTAVHKICSLVSSRLRGSTAEEIVWNSRWDPHTTNPTLIGYGYAAAKWYADSGFQPELIERAVASTSLQIAGTLDQWGLLDSLRTLVDFKSGQPQPAANIQTAIYARCLEETLGYQTDQRIVVWLRADGTYKAFPPRPSGGIDLSIGIAAVSLYHWRRQNRML